MSFFSSFKKLLKSAVIGEVKDGIKDTMDMAEEKIQDLLTHLEERATKFTHNFIKSLMLFTMIVVGGIFGLVGIAQIINIPFLGEGGGYLVVGVGIILLAVFALSMQKE